MAAPNIVGVTSIFGRTAGLTPANTTANVLVANPASSGKVFKINLIMAANINGSTAADTSVSWNTTATGSGTSFPLISTASVPADASLIVVDKSTSFYLEENEAIMVTSGTSGQIAYTVSYEEIF